MTQIVSKTSPWPHQEAGYWWVIRCWLQHGGAMLAFDMGTGKSKVTVDLIMNGDWQFTLIAAPLRVVSVWPNQFFLHAVKPPQLVILDDALTGAEKATKLRTAIRLAEARHERLVVIVNYDSLWREEVANVVTSISWGLIVCDESHRVKNPQGKAAKFVSRLARQARRRLALTGTPMAHSPLDIFKQFHFLDARIFGHSFIQFKTRFAKMGGFGGKQVVGYQNEEELNRAFHKLAMRVSKREVLQLPPVMHENVYCALEPKAAKIYRGLETEMMADVEAGVVTAANAAVKLMRLQQVTGGTVKTEAGEMIQVSTAKQKLLIDTLADLPEDEPVVVVCRYHADLDIVHAAAADAGRRSAELSGRRSELAEWQKPGGPPVLAVQITAGGVGVDMTRSAYAIIYSHGFSLADYEQFLARLDRPGQTRPVTYYHLLVQNSIDERVMRAIEKRANVIEEILTWMKRKGRAA